MTTKHTRALQALDALTGAQTNARLVAMAKEAAANPDPKMQFFPVAAKLIAAKGNRYANADVVADDGLMNGVPFNPMQRGDEVVLARKTQINFQPGKGGDGFYEEWIPARCVGVTDKGRTFNAPKGDMPWLFCTKRDAFTIYRVPYQWRPAVAALIGQTFETREAIEAAMAPEPMRMAA